MTNVLLILSDQHQAACTGYEGHPHARTPRLDALAASATAFRHAYCQNPICTPSRVSILAGQYPHNTGYYGLSGPRPLQLPSFPQHFKSHGYRTALIGKLHLPKHPDHWARDHVDLFCECMRPDYDGHPYYDELRRKGIHGQSDHERWPEFPGDQHQDGRPSATGFDDSVEGFIVRRATRFIDEDPARPFCMEVSFFRPHQCYTPARPFWDQYGDDLPLPPHFDADPAGRPPHFQATHTAFQHAQGLLEPKDHRSLARRAWRGYLGNISHIDHAVGLLLDHLDRTGRAKDTIVVYGSDHGAYTGTFGIPEKAPGICSEQVCRVPLLIRAPGITPGVTTPNTRCDALVENVDLAPTLAALCGLPPMTWTDGVDLTPLLRGQVQQVKDAAVTENPWSRSLRFDRWRFVHYQRAMFSGQDHGELYDLHADPHELHNLYHDPGHRGVVEDARRRLLEWLIGTTRHVTAWTPPFWPKLGDDTAPDGKESNAAGVALRVRQDMLNYL